MAAETRAAAATKRSDEREREEERESARDAGEAPTSCRWSASAAKVTGDCLATCELAADCGGVGVRSETGEREKE